MLAPDLENRSSGPERLTGDDGDAVAQMNFRRAVRNVMNPLNDCRSGIWFDSCSVPGRMPGKTRYYECGLTEPQGDGTREQRHYGVCGQRPSRARFDPVQS